MSSYPTLGSLDTLSLVSIITHLIQERESLRGQLVLAQYHAAVQAKAVNDANAHAMTLASQITSLQISLNAVLRLQNAADVNRMPDEAAADDEEESMLELYELRRWKQQFAVAETRTMVDRLDELTSEVCRLREIVARGDKR